MAKSGGAWKVAYADFVTAMMAFFLVMWICGQDQKIKRAVSYYFADPFGATNVGTSKKPNRTGSVTEFMNNGSVPQTDAVASGRGRDLYSTRRDGSRGTKLVSDWLHHDATANRYWQDQAQRQRETARQAAAAGEPWESAHRTAVRQLSEQLRDEVKRGIPSQGANVYRDLLTEAMDEVNWVEIAEDLLPR